MSVWRSARRSTRGEQPDEGVEVDEKNDQIALRRIVAGREDGLAGRVRKSSGMMSEIAIRQRQAYACGSFCLAIFSTHNPTHKKRCLVRLAGILAVPALFCCKT
jgi:hypothetical protein